MARTGIKVAQFANGIDGELFTWDSSGNPTTVAVGTSGHVLTSNGIGAAPTFQAVSGGGSSSGIAGAVQISGGSGAFSSDATNFFFDDSTNQLQLAGGTSYGIAITGQNGGINVEPGSSITGALNAYRVSADATGLVNLSLNNTNTSSGGVRVVLAAATGGGDPYVTIGSGEITYVLGMDNSDSNNLFHIGSGTNPSSMTTSNIVLKGANTGIATTAPTARLHLPAGTTTAETAPAKLTSGTAMTTPEDGALEYHSSHLYFTIGSTRYQLDQQSASVRLDQILAANTTNTIDSLNHVQTWNWSTQTTGYPFVSNANALTSGGIMNLVTTNSSVNSSNGLLYVNNSSSSTSGVIFKVAANNSVSGAGMVVRANGTVGVGLTSSTAMLHLGGTPNLANGTTNGMFFRADASGITDTTSSGTVAFTAISSFNTPQVAATSSTTYTDAATLVVQGVPFGLTNVTITNAWALYTLGGASVFSDNVSTNSTVTDRLILKTSTTHGSNGAANFGTGIKFLAETTTTDNQDQTRISSIWSTATHASRQSALVFSTVFNASALTELVRMDGKQMKVTGQYASTRFALTDGATIALDWNNSNVQSVTLGGNRTFTFTNPMDGGRYLLYIKQDGTGSRTLTWPTIKWAGGTAPTLTTTANKYDLITITYDGTNYYGSASLNH